MTAPARRAWDAFAFCGELDLLEARLTELDGAAYRHVLVEAPVTYQGDPKPLHYAENRERFAPWHGKIIHVIADLADCPDVLAREYGMREAALRGLDGWAPGDLFLLSDADEIPCAEVIPELSEHAVVMHNHAVAVNLLEPGLWIGTLATVSRPHVIARQFYTRQKELSLKVLRNPVGMPRAVGHHFSWLGGPEAMRKKAASFGHPQMAAFIEAEADRLYRDRAGPATGSHLLQVVIDGSFPEYMQDRKGPASWYWPGE
jgi:Glycosyltransferase family 17